MITKRRKRKFNTTYRAPNRPQNNRDFSTYGESFPPYCVLSREVANTNFIVFGLTGPGIEPTIYRTRGEHAKQYSIDAVTLCHIILHKVRFKFMVFNATSNNISVISWQ